MRAEAPFSLPELVRAEIADDLRTCGCSLAALTVERNISALTAEAIAADLERMQCRVASGTSTRAFLRATAEAVTAFASGDINGAVAILAEHRCISAEEWIAEARRGRGL